MSKKAEKTGELIVVSGFSGVGKGTIIGRAMQARDDFAFSVSATTRAPREGEEHGVQYFFLTREDFEQRIADGKFLEYAEYSGNYYGTLRDYVDELISTGKNVVLDVDYRGAFAIDANDERARLIFIIPPSAEALYARLTGRGTETEESIIKRINQAITEADQADKYNCILVNDDLDLAVDEFLAIVDDPSLDRKFYEKNLQLIPPIKSGLKQILEDLRGPQEGELE